MICVIITVNLVVTLFVVHVSVESWRVTEPATPTSSHWY